MKGYVPGSGSGGAGSKHAGQGGTTNKGGQGSTSSGPVFSKPQSCQKVSDTAKPKDNSKKSPKIFG